MWGSIVMYKDVTHRGMYNEIPSMMENYVEKDISTPPQHSTCYPGRLIRGVVRVVREGTNYSTMSSSGLPLPQVLMKCCYH